MSVEFRDRIAMVVYVRDRFDGPAVATADAILAMSEMVAIREAAAWAIHVAGAEAFSMPQSVIDWVLGDPS